MLLNATKAGSALAPAESPKMFLKKSPATITPESASSCAGIAAKYATLART